MRETIVPWLNDHVGTWPVIGPLFQGPPIGAGMLTSGIVLSIMVIPFISSVMREVFLTVPTRLKESAYALGSTKWEVSWDIVLPYTRSAVIGGAVITEPISKSSGLPAEFFVQGMSGGVGGSCEAGIDCESDDDCASGDCDSGTCQ